ncbi:MAG: cell division topological specificity factor MinE [Clostridia bacterium]|nr:cell division topological specificity factor MinE [Clostridia bacterium]
MNFFKNLGKSDKTDNNSRDTAKERLHLVLMQDRANISADFLDLMRQEIIEVIKKYVDVDESEIDVRMTSKQNEDGSNGAPALFANIPIINIKNDILVEKKKEAEDLKRQPLEENQVSNECQNDVQNNITNNIQEGYNENNQSYEQQRNYENHQETEQNQEKIGQETQQYGENNVQTYEENNEPKVEETTYQS